MHAHGHGADVVGNARKLGGSPRVVKRKARRRNGTVVVDRPAEQLLALQRHADFAAQRPRVQTCQVAPVVAHGAALRNLEARRGKLFCGSFFCGVCGGLLDHGVLLGYGAFLDFSRLVGFGIFLVGKIGHNGAFLGNLRRTRFVGEISLAIGTVPVCRVALGLGCGGLGLNLPQAVGVVGRAKLAVFGAAHSAHGVAGARGRTAAVAVAYVVPSAPFKVPSTAIVLLLTSIPSAATVRDAPAGMMRVSPASTATSSVMMTSPKTVPCLPTNTMLLALPSTALPAGAFTNEPSVSAFM